MLNNTVTILIYWCFKNVNIYKWLKTWCVMVCYSTKPCCLPMSRIHCTPTAAVKPQVKAKIYCKYFPIAFLSSNLGSVCSHLDKSNCAQEYVVFAEAESKFTHFFEPPTSVLQYGASIFYGLWRNTAFIFMAYGR